jgi:hypothetical protein
MHARFHDNDEARAAMIGLRRDVWQRVRALALDGFARCSDGRLYHYVIVEKARAAFAGIEKREKRKADDRRRQNDISRPPKAGAGGGGTRASSLCGTQRGHFCSCKHLAAFVKRSPDTATAEDIRGSSCIFLRRARASQSHHDRAAVLQ